MVIPAGVPGGQFQYDVRSTPVDLPIPCITNNAGYSSLFTATYQPIDAKERSRFIVMFRKENIPEEMAVEDCDLLILFHSKDAVTILDIATIISFTALVSVRANI